MIHREDLVEFSKFVLSLALGEDAKTNFIYNSKHVDDAVKLIRMRFLPVEKEERIRILKSDTAINAFVDSLDVDDDYLYIADLDSFIDKCESIIMQSMLSNSNAVSDKDEFADLNAMLDAMDSGTTPTPSFLNDIDEKMTSLVRNVTRDVKSDVKRDVVYTSYPEFGGNPYSRIGLVSAAQRRKPKLDTCPTCGGKLTSEGICLNVTCDYSSTK